MDVYFDIISIELFTCQFVGRMVTSWLNNSGWFAVVSDGSGSPVPHSIHGKCVAARAQHTYRMITHGNCPADFKIDSLWECSVAAQYLSLPDTIAASDGQTRVSYDPPNCYYEGGELKLNDGTNSGSCTSSDQCLCRQCTY